MIPYFVQPKLSLGPITIYAFGVLVATAILLGMYLIRRRAAATGRDPVLAERLTVWILLGGFAGAHLVDRFAYFPHETLQNPVTILRFWEGISSFGGFLGAIVAAIWFIRKMHLGADKWRYLDLIAYAFPSGWVFGRMGCFVAFDHPGFPTTFFLAERYTDGLVRHNLGLDEALYTLPLALLFLWLGRRGREQRPGFFVGLLAVAYAPVRFLLDFLRFVDVRYLGLTPGQYGAIGLLIVGLVILFRRQDQGAAQSPQELPRAS